MLNIIIIGPPGSGKDTQIDRMSEYLGFELISTGDIARKLAEKSSKIRAVLDGGGLITDDVILKEVDERLSKLEPGMGVVLDGFPRNLHQAEMLNEMLMHRNRTLDKVIYIDLDEQVIVDRLSRRYVCSLCGHNILGETKKCVVCGGRPVRRPDDEPAVIIKRVQTYLENTLPLINYYRNRGILIEIDGDQSIEAVATDIKEKLGGNDNR